MSDQTLAVIDIGSNSGRVIVVRMHGGHLTVLADGRVALRLAAELPNGVLSPGAIARTVAAVRDFQAVARSAGATQSVAVATSAVRESSNANDLVGRIARECDVAVEVIDGDREAAYSFSGALWGLDVDSGILVDIGGGSVEVTRFAERRLAQAWTLPLGSLRVSAAFLPSDPPPVREVKALRAHVAQVLHGEGIPALSGNDVLVGTGGTIRALAKIDRRTVPWPIPLIHGSVLPQDRLRAMTGDIVSRRAADRSAVAGLSETRADSIAGGALVLDEIMRHSRAESLVVSGQGLREGIALEHLGYKVGPAAEVRRASVAALGSRFTTWNAARATRRAATTATLLAHLQPNATEMIGESLEHAAMLLDVGAAVDHYNRSQHAATIVLSSDLAGFTHAHLALVALLIRRAERPASGLKDLRRVAGVSETIQLPAAATVLALADELEKRLLPGWKGTVTCTVDRRTVRIGAAASPGDWSAAMDERVRASFGKRLIIEETA